MSQSKKAGESKTDQGPKTALRPKKAVESRLPEELKRAPEPKAVISTPGSTYSTSELAVNAAKVFGKGMRSECVAAALRSKNQDRATVDEAKKIVETFMRKEIR